MEFNKLVFAGLSVGCLAAAAGGSYLAVRQNQSAPGAMDANGAYSAVVPDAAPGTSSATTGAQCTGHRIGRRDWTRTVQAGTLPPLRIG